METVETSKAGRALWTMASVLLLLVWVAAMSLDDDVLCSSVPLCFGFAAVLLLAVVGMVVGARPARPTVTCLMGLAAGLYFLIRCLAGDMLSETARELPLILAAFTFYGAGYLMAQRRGGTALTVALVVGVLANVVYFILLRDPEMPQEITGRPSVGLTGPNTRRCALFTYKNFAAIFLTVAGGVLICRPLWRGWKGWGDFLAALVGMAGVACACLCYSRSVLGLPPFMLLSAWVLWAIISLYSREGIGWGVGLSGLALMLGTLVLLGDLLLGHSVLRQILSVDTHGRTSIWSYIYDLLPQVPWCGHGVGATQWQLVPVMQCGEVPNYAHNDYLQAWVDYGFVGLVLVLAVLLLHLASGFWCLASEDIDRRRRALVAAALLILLSLAGCAVFDFVWHNVALVGFSAFACGVLAAPIPSRREPLFSRRKWAAGHRPALRPVRFMGQGMAAVTCIACVGLAAGSACFAWRLLPAWQAQWEYNAMCRAKATPNERAAFLERVMRVYPDPELVDHYMHLRPSGNREEHRERKEEMLRLALRSNPHQLFTATMLADTLSRRGKCAEAEALLRDYLGPEGLPGTRLGNWPAYYGINLLKWGHQRMVEGDHASALSMMEYALNLWGHADGLRFISDYTWVARERNEYNEVYIAARRVDVDMLRAIGVQKDDSWQQPLHPGEPGALYKEWGTTPHSAEYADPYFKRSPLKFRQNGVRRVKK